MIFLGVCSLIVLVIAATISLNMLGEKNLRSKGDQIILKLEAFKHAHGHLPATLGEIGEPDKEDGPIYYQRESGGEYQVWYGLSLGESRTYTSVSKTWK